MALKKEEGSIKFYETLLKKHPELKELMYTLISQEQQHKKLIENKIVELTV